MNKHLKLWWTFKESPVYQRLSSTLASVSDRWAAFRYTEVGHFLGFLTFVIFVSLVVGCIFGLITMVVGQSLNEIPRNTSGNQSLVVRLTYHDLFSIQADGEIEAELSSLHQFQVIGNQQVYTPEKVPVPAAVNTDNEEVWVIKTTLPPGEYTYVTDADQALAMVLEAEGQITVHSSRSASDLVLGRGDVIGAMIIIIMIGIVIGAVVGSEIYFRYD